jgi:hypothetical protein
MRRKIAIYVLLYAKATYDGKQTPASALANFFDAIYYECGSPRPKR